MTRKGQATHATEIPIDYVLPDTTGNRRSRRLAARIAKARSKGRATGTSTGAEPVDLRLNRRTSEASAEE